jgi:DME family drug/metabolite transporter
MPVLVLVLAGLCWGSGGVLGTLLADRTGLPPLAVAGYRHALGGALLLVPLLVSGRRPRGRRAWWRVAVVGALAAVLQACYFTAVATTSVSLATLVTVGSAPVIVLLVERTGGRAVAATVGLALVGIVALVGLPGGGLDPAAAVLGSAFAVVAGAAFAAVTLLGARPVPGLEPATGTGPALAGGGLVLLGVAGRDLAFDVEPGPLALLIAFALVTAAGYALYFRLLSTTTATLGAVAALLEPMTAAVLGAVLLGDRLGVAGTAGALLVGAAVVLAGRLDRARRGG